MSDDHHKVSFQGTGGREKNSRRGNLFRLGRRGISVFLAAFVAMALIVLATWIGISRVETQVRGELSVQFKQTLHAVIDAVQGWQEEKKADTAIWAQSTEVLEAASWLSRYSRDPDALSRHPTQKKLRDILSIALREHGYLGYFLLSPETRVLAADTDADLGQFSHLTRQSGAVQKVLEARVTIFSNPFNPQELDHENTGGEDLEERVMLVAAPVFNDDRVVAVLVFLIDPSHEFSSILLREQLGKSGETYAFDRFGRMISRSRVEGELRTLGLLADGKTSAFNIHVRDPGGNLYKGFVPKLSRDKQPLTRMARNAVAGTGGMDLDGYRDYRGVPVVGTWAWDQTIGIGVAVEIDKDEIYQTLNVTRFLMIVGAGAFCLLIIFINIVFYVNRKKTMDGEQRLSSIFDTVLDGLITINKNGIIETANPAATHIFGYAGDEFAGRNVKMLMPEPYRSSHDGYLQNYLRTGLAKIIGIGREVEGLRRDGSTFPLELSISEFSHKGERMFLGIVRDISERKKISDELSRFKSTLDRTLDCVFMFGPDPYQFFYVNQGAMDLVGYTSEELTRMTAMDIMPAYDHVEFKKAMAPLVKGEKSTLTFETLHQHNDGSLIPVEVFLQYIAPEGEEPRFVAIARDISERLQSRESLKQSETSLNRAQQIARLGSWDWNIRSGELHWSDEVYRIFGFEPQQIKATYDSFLGAIHPEDREAVQKAVSESIENKGGYHIIHRIVQPNGVVLYVEEQGGAEYDDNGEAIFMNGIVQDITERMAADKLKREFISTVSHELRTPLTAIHGSHGLLLGGVAGDLSEQAKSLLTIAHDNSDRLIRLINDILDIEKLEAGRMNFEMVLINLKDQIRKSIIANEMYAKKHEVSIMFSDEGLNGQIYADGDRLAQVMANFLSNAIKFSPAGSVVDVSCSDEGDVYRIMIADHGPGIPEEFRDRIFQRFAQADSSDTRKKGGTGLGLSIVKAIVECMDGEVGFETSEGKGATFWFTLPKPTDPTLLGKSQVEPIVSEKKDGMPSILHVEDDPDIAKVVKVAMAGVATVDSASTLETARAHLARHRYDLVLLDIQLPDGSALPLLPELKADGIPVVIFSATDFNADLAQGVSAVLTKSKHGIEDVLSTVKRLISARS